MKLNDGQGPNSREGKFRLGRNMSIRCCFILSPPGMGRVGGKAGRSCQRKTIWKAFGIRAASTAAKPECRSRNRRLVRSYAMHSAIAAKPRRQGTSRQNDLPGWSADAARPAETAKIRFSVKIP
jgi:hypothetical protein